MGRADTEKNVVLLFENYLEDSIKLHTSFKMAKKKYKTVVIDDDGFLPDDVESVYGYFLGNFKKSKNALGKPRYFNQINVPDFWEISANNRGGKIYELNKEKGNIIYVKPLHKRLVKAVEWYDEKGVVRSCDHYNKYGALYARTVYDSKGKQINKSYFSSEGLEIIMENYVTKDIVLNDGNKVIIFQSKTDFICYFLKEKGYNNYRLFYNTLSLPFFVSHALSGEPGNEEGDILFWQEKERNDIPGNMQIILNGQSRRTGAIKVLDKNAYDSFIRLGVDKSKVQKLGYIYKFKKKKSKNKQTLSDRDNKYYGKEALICTNSDRIACIEEFIKELPDVRFNIVAITEMSSKLMQLEQYDNVSLYPNVRMNMVEDIFIKCDYYLDINHENEIISAVQSAFLCDHIIMAFNETMHNREYVATEHIYNKSDYKKMIDDIRAMLSDDKLKEKHLEIQHKFAGLESSAAYEEL